MNAESFTGQASDKSTEVPMCPIAPSRSSEAVAGHSAALSPGLGSVGLGAHGALRCASPSWGG